RRCCHRALDESPDRRTGWRDRWRRRHNSCAAATPAVLEIDVNEADGRLLEDTDCGLVGLRSSAQPMALKTTMNGAAGRSAGGMARARHGRGRMKAQQTAQRSENEAVYSRSHISAAGSPVGRRRPG